MSNRENVYVYWDNSNIFISAKEVAGEREDAYSRVRISFSKVLQLAHADRKIVKGFVVGSIPPELKNAWTRLENENPKVKVELFERGELHGREVNVDQALQNEMLRDLSDWNGDPGIAVLLTGDGSGFEVGKGFYADLERMRRKGWRMEVLSWQHSCKRAMQEWAKEHGKFIALDDFYESITFLESPMPGQLHAEPRRETPLDLSRRVMVD